MFSGRVNGRFMRLVKCAQEKWTRVPSETFAIERGLIETVGGCLQVSSIVASAAVEGR